MIVVFSGPSGVGKNTVINQLLYIHPDQYDILPTLTTRERRAGETEGHPYYFIDESEFKKKLKAGEFYEHQIVHDHFYGTSKIILSERLKAGKILLKDIDVYGTMNLVKALAGQQDLLTFFFLVKNKNILIDRLTERGESQIDFRLQRYEIECTFANKYHYIINNISLEETSSLVHDIIMFENSGRLLFSTGAPRRFSEEKISEYAQLMREGVIFDPIDVAVKDDNIYIIDGHHRYLASILSKKNIAKFVVKPDCIDEVEQFSWEELIARLKRTDGMDKL